MYNENEGNEEIEFYQVVFPDGAAFNLLHIDWDVQFGLKVMTNQPSSLSLDDIDFDGREELLVRSRRSITPRWQESGEAVRISMRR